MLIEAIKSENMAHFSELIPRHFCVLGPIRTSKKVLYLDKFSVIANASQVRTVCRDLTNFVRSGLIFKRTADKICPG